MIVRRVFWVVSLLLACGGGTAPTPPPAGDPTQAPSPPSSEPSSGRPTDPDAAEVTLASRAGSALALTSTEVFYATVDQPELPASTRAEYPILAVSKAGGPPRRVSVGAEYPVALAANEQFVYWATSASSGPVAKLYRAPASGGAAEVVFSGLFLSDLAVDDRNIYFESFPGTGAGTGAVYVLPHTSRSPLVLHDGLTMWGWRTGFAIDDEFVYFVDDPPPANLDGTGDRAFILRVPKSGGAAEVVVDCASDRACGWFAIRADRERLYFLDAASDVWAQRKTDGERTKITTLGKHTDFDVNGSSVYATIDWWNARWNPDPWPRPGLTRADGTGEVYLDSSVMIGWTSPRVDDRYVYYVRSDQLVRHVR